jgi:kynurenine formamidase
MRIATVTLSLAILLLGCVTDSGAPADSGSTLDLASAEVIDLSHTYGDDTLYWPTSPSAFELEELHRGPTEAGFFYAANSFSTPEHGGTHLDAPFHFAEEAWAAHEIPLERLIGPAVVIDVAASARRDPDYLLTVDDVSAWEAVYGAIPAGAIVLLHTGWGSRWPDRKAYLGDDTPGDASSLHFPSYGEEAARMLIEERGAAVLGVDTASIDGGTSQYFLVHQVAAAANVPGLENLANLERLPPTGAWVFALPMKIGGGSGGPARVVALL